jgi:hypothetical protein
MTNTLSKYSGFVDKRTGEKKIHFQTCLVLDYEDHQKIKDISKKMDISMARYVTRATMKQLEADQK